MLVKSSTEISDEIQLLRDQLPKIWDGCEYADLNRTSIRAQIEVLEKRMAEDAVATAYGDSDSPDYVPYVYDSALTACHWMIGKSKNRPNDDWSGLL